MIEEGEARKIIEVVEKRLELLARRGPVWRQPTVTEASGRALQSFAAAVVPRVLCCALRWTPLASAPAAGITDSCLASLCSLDSAPSPCPSAGSGKRRHSARRAAARAGLAAQEQQVRGVPAGEMLHNDMLER